VNVRINRKLAAKALAEGRPLSEVAERGVGKSTGAILSAIARSIEMPQERITVVDPDLVRQQLGYRDRVRLYGTLAALAEELIKRLELEDMKVDTIVGDDSRHGVFITNRHTEAF